MSSSMRSSPLFRHGLPLVAFCVVVFAGLSHFVENRVEAMDARRRTASARQVQLEMAHTAFVQRLGVGASEDFVAKPIPRPKEDR